MHCGRVSNLLSAYIDREVAGAEMLQIRRHLDGCPGCYAEHEALCRVKAILSAALPAAMPGDMTAAAAQRRMQRWEQPPAVAPHWQWRWKWMSVPRRWQRYSLAFTTGCLAVALAGTALALRKPNYPDAVAANVLPSLSLLQSEERLPPLEPFAPGHGRWVSEDTWNRFHPAAPPQDAWRSGAGPGVHPMFVSDHDGSSSWGGRPLR